MSVKEVIRLACANAGATVAALPEHSHQIDLMAKLVSDLAGTPGRPADTTAEMAVRSLVSHGTFFYVSGVQNAMTCQAYAVPVLIRAAIECIGYAARCRDSAEAAEVWRQRHVRFLEAAADRASPADAALFLELDRDARLASRQHFTRREFEASLQRVMLPVAWGAEVVAAVMRYYDLAIDMGAHPNVLMTQLGSQSVVPDEGELAYRVHFLLHSDVRLVRSQLEMLFQLGALIVQCIGALLPQNAAEVDAPRRLGLLGQAWTQLSTDPDGGAEPQQR